MLPFFFSPHHEQEAETEKNTHSITVELDSKSEKRQFKEYMNINAEILNKIIASDASIRKEGHVFYNFDDWRRVAWCLGRPWGLPF